MRRSLLLVTVLLVTACGSEPAGLSSMPDFGVVSSPEQGIQLLIDDVHALVGAGVLSENQANGLIAKLKKAIGALEKGQLRVATNKLADFIDQVRGVLSPEDGQPLIDAAESIIELLGGDPNTTLVITTTSLRDGVQNVAYSEILTAAGGHGKRTWSLPDGSLPTGLSLDTSTGEITGTPTVVETSTFTVQASGGGQAAQQALTITVNPPVLLPSELCSDFSDVAIATFVDANLEAAIRAALSIGQEDALTCGHLGTLTNLTADNAGIVSLEGIQNLRSLTALRLANNSVSNISSLRGLTSLTLLVLSQNLISDISALSGLTSLTNLSLWGNAITDVSAVGGLTSLWYLGLNNNSLTDISALSGLTSLTNLNLESNSLTDISALSGLTSLRGLNLNTNTINDINGLSGLTSLTSLQLRGNPLSGIHALSGLTSLTFLSLRRTLTSDISALSGLTSLTVLKLSQNFTLSDISALSQLTSLTSLTLGSHSLTDISPLSGLTSLTDLFLSGISLTDVGSLSGLTSLTSLAFTTTAVSDISALSGLINLEVLSFFDTPNLSNIQPLLDNTGLGGGDTVALTGTNVSCTDVALLQAKGVTVTFNLCT